MRMNWSLKHTHLLYCSIVLCLADGRPKVRYVLAVDDSHNALKEIVKAISTHLGTGKIQYISKEDALLNKDISVSSIVIVIEYWLDNLPSLRFSKVTMTSCWCTFRWRRLLLRMAWHSHGRQRYI